MTLPPPPARVLVVQTSYLGDLVLATPVFAALKRQWPSSHLTAAVRPDVAPVLRGHPDVDAVLTDDKRGRNSGLGGFVRLVRELRGGRYDVAIALHRGARTSLLLFLAEVPLRVGFRQGELGFLYHRRVWRDPALHDIERQLSLLRPLCGEMPEVTPPHLGVDSEARRLVDEMLAAAGIDSARSYVVLAPGSAWRTKEWMPERFAAVAQALLAEGDEVVYVGAPSEMDTVRNVRRLAGGGVDLAGRTDTAGLAAVIARATAVVCNDSAPMHIAQAFAIPLVVVVGPTSAAQGFMPRFEPRAITNDPSLTCRPLCRFGGDPCAFGTRACLVAVEPGDVLAALAEMRASRSLASAESWSAS